MSQKQMYALGAAVALWYYYTNYSSDPMSTQDYVVYGAGGYWIYHHLK